MVRRVTGVDLSAGGVVGQCSWRVHASEDSPAAFSTQCGSHCSLPVAPLFPQTDNRIRVQDSKAADRSDDQSNKPSNVSFRIVGTATEASEKQDETQDRENKCATCHDAKHNGWSGQDPPDEGTTACPLRVANRAEIGRHRRHGRHMLLAQLARLNEAICWNSLEVT